MYLSVLLLAVFLAYSHSQLVAECIAKPCDLQTALRAELACVTKETVKEELGVLKKEIDDLKAKIKVDNDERSPPLMFYGQLTKPVHYSDGRAYNFSSLYVNEGNGYDLVSAKFICQKSGWYYFMYSLSAPYLSKGNKNAVYGALMKGQITINFALGNFDFETARTDHIDLTVSNGAILKCYKGEEVWVRTWDKGGDNVKTDHGDFIAMLIHKA